MSVKRHAKDISAVAHDALTPNLRARSVTGVMDISPSLRRRDLSRATTISQLRDASTPGGKLVVKATREYTERVQSRGNCAMHRLLAVLTGLRVCHVRKSVAGPRREPAGELSCRGVVGASRQLQQLLAVIGDGGCRAPFSPARAPPSRPARDTCVTARVRPRTPAPGQRGCPRHPSISPATLPAGACAATSRMRQAAAPAAPPPSTAWTRPMRSGEGGASWRRWSSRPTTCTACGWRGSSEGAAGPVRSDSGRSAGGPAAPASSQGARGALPPPGGAPPGAV